jgi:hypothetical protein
MIGLYNWGERGVFYGVGIGFMLSPLIGYILQISSNKKQIQSWAREYIARNGEQVDKAFPETNSMKRARLIEHTMLSISAVINNNSSGQGQSADFVDNPEVRRAVSQYAKDCVTDKKIDEMENLVMDVYEWLLAKQKTRKI